MNKYRTAPKAARTMDGIVFDSKAEMVRYCSLRIMERAGLIADLELQPQFVLLEGFRHPEHGRMSAIRYRADFRYREAKTGKIIVEDVKGARTDVYRIKKILLLWRYPELNFVEVKV